ncbi:MAG: glycosyltransferase family 2 protein [Pseudomonadota bacterium]
MNQNFCIITITKNNLDGLQRTAKSIQLQTIQDFEWIVIDAASTDGTTDFLKTSQADWTSEPDHGLYDAMNKGLEKASGTYIIFMNAGDTFADVDILELITDQLETNPDFLYGDALESNENGDVRYKPARPYTKSVRGMFTHHQSMIYKREAVGDLRYDTQYKLAADYDFTMRFLKKAERITYCPFPICIFESGGVSQQNAGLSRAEEMDIKTKLNLCSPFIARTIAILQAASLAFKSKSPRLYWFLKSRTAR